MITPRRTLRPNQEEQVLLFRRMGHDMNNALTIQTAKIQMAQLGYRVDFNDLSAINQHINNIYNAISRLGCKSSSKISFAARQVFEDLSNYIMAENKENISIKEEIEDCDIEGSPQIIYMQLFSFLKNASRSMPKEQQNKLVTLGIKELPINKDMYASIGHNRINYSLNDNMIQFYVEDNGSGIKEEELEHIFKEWSGRGSTGIGLALTDMVCDYSHGFVTVESQVGVGSKFSLYVPKERRSV